jgi:probable addiction module antidote protein
MTKTTFSTFDAADYLDNDEVIAEYLSAAMQDENPDVLLMALLDVAKAQGMARVARDAGLGRESLYKALTAGAKPRFETVAAVMRALNIQMTAKPRVTVRTGSTRKAKRAAKVA